MQLTIESTMKEEKRRREVKITTRKKAERKTKITKTLGKIMSAMHSKHKQARIQFCPSFIMRNK